MQSIFLKLLKRILNLEEKMKDTGWIDIEPLIGNKNTNYYVPQYRKIGNIVYIRGVISQIKEASTAIFTLPEGFYNKTRRLNFLSTNDNCETHELRILNNGNVVIYKSSGDISKGLTITLSGITFPVD